MLQALVEVEPRFRKSGQQQLLLETLLVRFALLDRTVDLEAVLRGLGNGGGGGAPPAPSATRAAAPAASPRPAAAPPAADEARRPGPAGASLRAAFDGAVAEAASRAPVSRPSSAGTTATVPGAAPSSGPRAAVAEAMTPVPERPAPVRASSPTADAAPRAGSAFIDVAAIAERWNQVVEFARAARPLVGAALSAALPIASAASGAVTIELQEANSAYVQALESGRDDVLAAVRLVHPGATRVIVRAPDDDSAAPKERLTAEGIRTERVTALSRRDPVLGAAIEALDLDLLD